MSRHRSADIKRGLRLGTPREAVQRWFVSSPGSQYMGPICHAIYPNEVLTEQQAWVAAVRLLTVMYPHVLPDEWHSLTVYLDWQDCF